jgi:hypothetical protein
MRPRRLALLAAGLPMLAALAGCGYALAGKGIVADPSIKRIGVPLFKDATGKPGLDQQVTKKVIEELLKRGRFDVVETDVGVDAVVEGELRSYTAAPIGFSQEQGATQASRYVISLASRVRYAKVGAKDAIWDGDNFTVREEFDVGEDPQAFFDREDQSIDRLTTLYARQLVAAMLEAF